jgi:hypothetical protein
MNVVSGKPFHLCFQQYSGTERFGMVTFPIRMYAFLSSLSLKFDHAFSVFLFDLSDPYNIIRDGNSGMGIGYPTGMGTGKIFYLWVPLVTDPNRDWYGAGIFSHLRVTRQVPRFKHTMQNFRHSSFSPTHDSISASRRLIHQRNDGRLHVS